MRHFCVFSHLSRRLWAGVHFFGSLRWPTVVGYRGPVDFANSSSMSVWTTHSCIKDRLRNKKTTTTTGVRERGQSSLRCWPENDEQLHGSEFKGKLNGAGRRGQSSLRCWPVNYEQFHGSELKGQLHGWRRRGERTISSSRCSSSAQVGGSSACSARFLGVAEAGSGSDPSVSHSFVVCDSSFSVRVESPSSRAQRVNAALRGDVNACDTHNSQNSYSVHDACVVLKWMSLLMHSRRLERCMSRRGQAFCRNRSSNISQEVEIVPGCVVTVACPSCPDNSPVSPGPGRVIRNMLG